MILLAFAFALCSTAFLIRAYSFPTREVELRGDGRYWFLIVLSLIGSSIAFFGFRELANAPANASADYTSVLTILSLLAAGVIAGYYGFTFWEAAEDEYAVSNAISIGFTLLFYFLFGAVSFYMGKSENIHSAENIATIFPLIMSLILAVNAVYDFWDYRKEEED